MSRTRIYGVQVTKMSAIVLDYAPRHDLVHIQPCPPDQDQDSGLDLDDMVEDMKLTLDPCMGLHSDDQDVTLDSVHMHMESSSHPGSLDSVYLY